MDKSIEILWWINNLEKNTFKPFLLSSNELEGAVAVGIKMDMLNMDPTKNIVSASYICLN